MTDQLEYAGKFLNLYKRGRWEFVKRSNAQAVVVIAALTDNQEIVLIEQVRLPLGNNGEKVLEVPAGLVGDDQADDDILAAARRELIEECGYDADELRVLTQGPSSAGLCDEIVTLVEARGLRKVAAGGGIGDEDIETILIPLNETRSYLEQRAAAGDLIDPKVYAALYFLMGE